MMNIDDFEHFRSVLTDREENLTEWIETVSTASDDELAKVRSLLTEIRQAIGRIEDKTYGICEVCLGHIEMHRLEVQPVAKVCLDCISPQEKELLEEELQIASKIHRALLPQRIERIDGFDVAVKALAARSIGGDYYDFLRSDNDSIVRVVIADSMGKGLPAGLLMSNFQGALRVLSQQIDSTSHLVSRLNHWLCRNVPVTKFISLTCVDLPIGAGPHSPVTFANAGHCPGIIMRADGRFECLDPTGGVIGVHEGFSYDEGAASLYPGDLLALYTDGVTEAENDTGEQFEQERLVESLRRHQSEPAEAIVSALCQDTQQFTGKSAFDDDFTAIVVKKL